MRKRQSRKVILFIVEGLTELTALEGILQVLFESSTAEVYVTYGDQFTDEEVPIKKKVGDILNGFLAKKKLHKKDIERIIILTDTDGCFIDDSCIQENLNLPRSTNYYFNDRIETWSKNNISKRNAIKSRNLSTVAGMEKVCDIPVEMYYFSCNLDHVLFGLNNLTDEEKTQYAEDFSLEYADREEEFLPFIFKHLPKESFSYSDSWKFIKVDTHSLKRFSNFFYVFKTHKSEVGPLAQQKISSLIES